MTQIKLLIYSKLLSNFFIRLHQSKPSETSQQTNPPGSQTILATLELKEMLLIKNGKLFRIISNCLINIRSFEKEVETSKKANYWDEIKNYTGELRKTKF